MRKNAQKVESKTWSKISFHYAWMLHAKNYPSQWRSLRSFLTTSKPSRRSVTAAKTREKGKRKGEKKFPKIEKPKDVGHFLAQILISAHARDAGGKKGQLLCCKRIFRQIKGNLAEI